MITWIGMKFDVFIGNACVFKALVINNILIIILLLTTSL